MIFNIISYIALIAGMLFFRPNTAGHDVKHFPPPGTLDRSHFGFNLVLSDLLWLDYIQNAFDCSVYIKERGFDRCIDRWGYLTLNEASQLDSKFKQLYIHGAVKLSVLLDDHEGANELFERGLGVIKDSWVIYYRAAYLNMSELNQPKKAAKYMEKASELGAPFWTRSLASRLYTESGEAELGYRILLELYEQADEGPWKEDLKKRIQENAKKLRKNSKSF